MERSQIRNQSLTLYIVMAGLVPAIHVFDLFVDSKTWMAGTRQHKAGHDG